MDLFDKLPPPKKQKSSTDVAVETPISRQSTNNDQNKVQNADVKTSTKSWGTMLLKPVIRKPQKAKKIVMPAFKTVNINSNEDGQNSTIPEKPQVVSEQVQEMSAKTAALPKNFRNSAASQVSVKASHKNQAQMQHATIPTSWTLQDVDAIPAQIIKAQQPDAIPNKNAVFANLDLSEYMIPVSNAQKANAKNMRDLDHISAKKSRFGKKDIYSGDQSINRNLLDSFDENEIYNPSIPNMYQHYKAWSLEKKKLELYIYFEKMKKQKQSHDNSSSSNSQSNSDAFSDNSSYSNSHGHDHNDGPTPRRSKTQSRKHSRRNESDRTYSDSGSGSGSSDVNRASYLEKRLKNKTNLTHPRDTKLQLDNPSMFPIAAKTGEEAYLARMRLSQPDNKAFEHNIPANSALPSSNNENLHFVKVNNISTDPSRVVVLKNMVGISEVDDALESETISECSKYGKITRCIVRSNISPVDVLSQPPGQVWIFVEFGDVEASKNAVSDLNGRYFGGRVVSASYFSEAEYFSHLK